MSSPDRTKGHHDDPQRSPASKEAALQLLASLLASTLVEQATIEDVRAALQPTRATSPTTRASRGAPAAAAAVGGGLSTAAESSQSTEENDEGEGEGEVAGEDEDSDAWRVRLAERLHARQVHNTSSFDRAAPSPGAPTTSTAATAISSEADFPVSSSLSSVTGATQAWVCPMCETVNWAVDARKSLRRRHDYGDGATQLSLAGLQCSCCGYGGSLRVDNAVTDGEEAQKKEEESRT